MDMRISGAAVLVGTFLLGAVATEAVAAAESIPLPVPSPRKLAQAVPAVRPVGTVPDRTADAAPAPLPAPGAGAKTAAVTPVAAPTQPGKFDGTQRALIDKVSHYLSGMQTLVGSFIQIGPDGGRTEGTFYIQKPGKVRFEYNPPSPIDVIADGSSVVVRDRKLATQDLYPLSQTPLRYLLVDKIDLLHDTNIVSVSADDVFVTVVIEEKQALTGTHRLMMMFSAQDLQLRQWTVTDPQGYDTTVAVYNLDPSKKPDPDLFKINYERMLQ
ncbi:hypothetical protein A33M_0976 [Rhodovulum sp. PH10]|nr:hypothetical protein A33M_0976 [Rhodovulum sp. PH10]